MLKDTRETAAARKATPSRRQLLRSYRAGEMMAAWLRSSSTEVMVMDVGGLESEALTGVSDRDRLE